MSGQGLEGCASLDSFYVRSRQNAFMISLREILYSRDKHLQSD